MLFKAMLILVPFVFLGTTTPVTPPAIPYEQAMDKSYTSEKFGISFRYPSTALVCDTTASVTVTEFDKGIAFEHNADCPPARFTVINVARAQNEAAVQSFVESTFSPECKVISVTNYEEESSKLARVEVGRKVPLASDEPDFLCGESPIWNRDAGVVLFSPMGSKTGGGMDWSAPQPFLMPDGTQDNAFDYAIMQSIRYTRR